MTTVLVNALVLNGSRSGYRRIIKDLIASIADNEHPSTYRFVFLFQQAGWDSLDLPLPHHPQLKIRLFRTFASKWTRGLAEQFLVPFCAWLTRAHLIFMPSTFGLLIPVRPTVVFVHTTTSFALPGRYRGRSTLQQHVHNALLRVTARTSSVLAFTSAQTHEEFSAYTRTSPPPLIIGNGLRPIQTNLAPADVHPTLRPRRYLLSVSQFYRLKNFDGLIAGFIAAKSTGCLTEDTMLAVVGTIQEQDYYEELQLLIRGRTDVLFLHNISDTALATLYRHAAGYAFFSLFEGFSLTPAEALLYGLPIALSAIPTHLEIYGPDVCYADPEDSEAIKAALCKLLQPHYSSANTARRIAVALSYSKFLERLYSAFNIAIRRSDS